MSNDVIAVAMSGGTDSSAAAALLLESGASVVGVTLRLWPSIQVEQAEQVAARLGIPFVELDLHSEFRQIVVDYFIEEYRSGRTPNPCVVCNPAIKFGLLLNYARTQLGAQKLATGHYARVEFDEQTQKWKLLRGIDRVKDQAYVLYRLGQNQLRHIVFPLGHHTKEYARSVVDRLQLPVRRSESQDICFVTEGDYRKFLAKNAPELVQPGPILDTTGKVIGQHRGIAFYTVGQRRGLKVAAGKRLYVVSIDPEQNAIILGAPEEAKKRTVTIESLTFVSGEKPAEPIVVSAKIRYNTQDAPARLEPMDCDRARLVFEEPQFAPAPGQSAVLYQGDEVIGGGIIADERKPTSCDAVQSSLDRILGAAK
ncbi:MAG: tRNA 2-thiouridine(34) synthase MnmA [Armatimonadota bacterium]|nr:tRNA 2-thiouridine(34) synthase MnmA [Armatimonadota bacterium]